MARRPAFVSAVRGKWWLAVETLEDRAWCETCGVRATGRGHRRVVVADLPLAHRPVVLLWANRLWRCTEMACSALNAWHTASRARWANVMHTCDPLSVNTERPSLPPPSVA